VPLGLLVQVVVIALEDHLPRELAGKFCRTALLHDGKATTDRPARRLPIVLEHGWEHRHERKPILTHAEQRLAKKTGAPLERSE
jgi:hypothetical protein